MPLIPSLRLRLALNDAVHAHPPLSSWVIRNVLSDPSFIALLKEALRRQGLSLETVSNGFDASPTIPSFTSPDPAIEEALRDLERDRRLRLLVSEWSQRWNERASVISGLRSRIIALSSFPSSTSEKSRDKESEYTDQGNVGVGPLPAMSPLVRWGAAGLLGAATVVGGNYYVRSTINSTVRENISEMSSRVSKEVAEEVNRTVNSKIEKVVGSTNEKVDRVVQDTNAIREVVDGCTSVGRCALDTSKAFDMPNPWIVKLQGPLEFKGGIPVSVQVVPDTVHLQTTASTTALPNPWTIKLDGVPQIPGNVRLEPNYFLDTLPPSLQVLDPDPKKSTPIRVEYPDSYKQMAECAFDVRLDSLADPARIQVSRTSDCESRVAPTTSLTIQLNQKPVYVPQIDAFVALNSQTQGFLRKHKTIEISIQAAPFYERKPPQKPPSQSDSAQLQTAPAASK